MAPVLTSSSAADISRPRNSPMLTRYVALIELPLLLSVALVSTAHAEADLCSTLTGTPGVASPWFGTDLVIAGYVRAEYLCNLPAGFARGFMHCSIKQICGEDTIVYKEIISAFDQDYNWISRDARKSVDQQIAASGGRSKIESEIQSHCLEIRQSAQDRKIALCMKQNGIQIK